MFFQRIVGVGEVVIKHGAFGKDIQDTISGLGANLKGNNCKANKYSKIFFIRAEFALIGISKFTVLG